MNKIALNLYLTGLTMLNLVRSYHLRLIRFAFHFLQWIPSIRKNHLPSRNSVEWVCDLIFYSVDLMVIPDFLEMVYTWFQSDIRMLDENEKAYVEKYFKNKVRINNIRMCYSIPAWFRNIAIAFVTFNTIHYNRKISLPIFIHEMVHIWQYQKFGSVYIYRALKAQKSTEGYDYGGVENLYLKMIDNYIFTDFNFEQQGEIFEDYCRIKEAEEDNNPIAKASFEYFVGQVQGDDFA